MEQYLDLLQKVLNEGTLKPPTGEGQCGTIGITRSEMTFDIERDGFPLLTTKKMFFKGIVEELLWIMNGDTNIKYLVDRGVNIWNDDAYRWYLARTTSKTLMCQDEFIDCIRNSPRKFLDFLREENSYILGNLGQSYGQRWRDMHGLDQLRAVIESLKTEPFSRRHIIDAWDGMDNFCTILPPCHCIYQFVVREKEEVKYLDMLMYQRSCDVFLGVPFNIASMCLFQMIIAKCVGMKVGVSTWLGTEVHIYTDHLPAVTEQLSRTPNDMRPVVEILKDIRSINDIESLTFDDFILSNYYPFPAIKAELTKR